MAEIDNNYKDLVSIDHQAQLEINDRLRKAGFLPMNKRKKRSYESENDEQQFSQWKNWHNQIRKSIVNILLDPEISSLQKKLILEHWLIYKDKLRWINQINSKKETVITKGSKKYSISKEVEWHNAGGLFNQFEDDWTTKMQYIEYDDLQRMLRIPRNTAQQRDRRALFGNDVGSGEVEPWAEPEDDSNDNLVDKNGDDEVNALHADMEAKLEEIMNNVIGEDELGDLDLSMDDFKLEKNGFTGHIQNDYEFKQFKKASRTSDYSDLVDVLKPSQEELDRNGHQAKDLIRQCSFDKGNCSYM